MSDEIFFDGVHYISAAEAGEATGFTRDYIAKLSREGKVVAKRVGKNWYVNDASLKDFLVGQQYSRSLRRESLVEKRVNEYHHLTGGAGAAAKSAPVMRTVLHESKATLTLPKSVPPIKIPTSPPAPAKAISGNTLSHVALMRGKISDAVVRHGKLLTDTTRDISSHAGLADATLRAAHVPAYAVTPFAEFLHKAIALTMAAVLTFGVYAIIDPQYAKFAIESAVSAAQSVEGMYAEASPAHIGNLALAAATQVKFTATHPGAYLAAAADFVPSSIADFAKRLNSTVDDMVYAMAFPPEITDTSSGQVAVEVQPYAQATTPTQTPAPAPALASEKAHAPVASAPVSQAPTTVIERIIERAVPAENVALAGGITEAYLDAKLAQLENKLSSKVYAVGSANSTAIIQNYNVTSQTNSINVLDNVGISNSRFTGGTISGASINSGVINGAAITASSLSVTDTTTLATTTINGDLTLGANLTMSGNLSGHLAVFGNASTTNLSVYNTAFFGGTATTTIDSLGNILGSGTLSMGTSTLTNLTVTNTSTSTFAGGFAIGNSQFVVQQATGNVGIGTSSPGTLLSIQNVANFTAATSTIFNGLQTGTFNVTGASTLASAIIVNATSTNFFATIASSSNAYAANFTAGLVNLVSATSTNLFATTASSTNLYGANLTAGRVTLVFATSTNFFATTASSTNLFAAASTLGTLSLVSGTSTNFFATTASSTNLFAAAGTLGTLSFVQGTSTNLFATTASSTNLYSALGTFGNATSSNNFFATKLVATSATTTDLYTTRLTIDSLSLNSGVGSNFVPSGNKTYDLGSPSFYWRTGYIDTITTNSISAASTTIGGTNSNTLTINADNATADTEDMSLIFFRGITVPNAVFAWNSALGAKRFELNQSTYISNLSGSTTQPTLVLQGVAGQTGNIFQIASSTGTTVFSVASDGSVTIATSTITALTSGTTTITNLAVTNTSTSSFAGPVTFGSNVFSTLSTGQVVLGAAIATSSALLQVDSTSKGFLPPRMTTIQKNAITSPNFGLVVYDTTLNKLNVYNGTTWKNVGSTELGGEVTSATAGSVLFTDTGTTDPVVLAQDNANFSFASTTHTLTLAKLSLTAGTSTNFFASTASSTNLFAAAGTLGTLSLVQGTSTNLFATTASSTNLFAAASTLGTLSLVQGTSTNFFATTASSTNLFAAAGTLGTLTISGVSTHTGLTTFTNGFISNASSTITSGLFSMNGGASTTNFTASSIGYFGTATSTTANANTATFGALNAGTFSLVQGTSTNFFATTASSTNLFAAASTFGTLSLVQGTSTNFFATTASSTNLFAAAATLGTLTISGASTHTGLTTFTNGFISNASSTITSGLFSMNGGASTTNFTVSSNAYFAGSGIWNSSGNVGIGSSTPLARLSVTGAGTGTGYTFLAANSNNIPVFTLLDNGGATLVNATSTNFFATTASSTNLFAAALAVGGNTLVTSSGNVGIGTTTTSAFGKLTVENTPSSPVDYWNATQAVFSDNRAMASGVGGGIALQGNYLSGGGQAIGAGIQASKTNGTSGDATFDLNVWTRSGTIKFQNTSTVGGTPSMVINSSGNVGIGTSSPYAKLAIAGAAGGSTNLLVISTSTSAFATTTALLIDQNGNLSLGNGSSLTVSGLAAAAGTFLAADPTGKLIATTSPGLAGTLGQVAYLSGTNTAVGTSTLFISTASNVGLGTTSPNAKLEIVKTSSGLTADQLYLTNFAAATSTASRLSFRTDDMTHGTGTTTAAITSILQQNFNTGKGDLVFSTLNAGNLTEGMRLTSTGNLGVGTSTPTYKVSVQNTASSPQFALAYDAAHWTTQQVDSSGNWTQTSTGGYNIFASDNVEICANGSCPTTTATSTQGNLFVENAVVIGDGFSLREIDNTQLGLYNVAGSLMVTFDNGN